MDPKNFISYRHTGVPKYVEIIRANLNNFYPEAEIFKDAVALKPGEEFPKKYSLLLINVMFF